MSRHVYLHDPINRIVAGTVGEPGDRTFFIQVKSETGLTAVVVEKSQLQALVERLKAMLRELRREEIASLDELNLSYLQDNDQLDYPISEDFRVGVIGISWDQLSQRVSIDMQAIGDETIMDLLDEEEAIQIEDAPDLLSCVLRIAQVRSFISRSEKVIASGRQPCPFCGLPIDPASHLCPRANGYRR